MIKRVINKNNLMFVMPWSLFTKANFDKYGFSNPDFNIFRCNSNFYFSKYDDSVQILTDSADGVDLLEMADFCTKNNIRMIVGEKVIMTRLSDLLKNYNLVIGHILRVDINHVATAEIKHAKTTSEFKEIANLLVGGYGFKKSYYKVEQYFKQIYERYQQGYTRNLIFNEDNKIVGHIATYAEARDYAVIGGLFVHENYRNHGIAKLLFEQIISELKKENKQIYLFCYPNKISTFYDKYCIEKYDCAKLLIK